MTIEVRPKTTYAMRIQRGTTVVESYLLRPCLLFTPVEQWRRAPFFLRAYVALNVAASLALAVLRFPVGLFGVPIALLFAYFLLRQNRIAWFLAIASQVIAAPTYITGHYPWIYLVWIGVDLILLLAPETRRFFSREPAEATAG